MLTRPTAALVFITSLTASAAPVLAAGDSAEGRRIATQWCSSCHVVDGQGRGGDAAPPFIALASNPMKTEDYLKNWIRSPHPPMPNFNLSRRDVDDLAAYIRSLAVSPGRAVPRR